MPSSNDSKSAHLIEAKVDPLLRRRAILTFLLQAIPWAIFVLIFVVDEFIVLSVDDVYENSKQTFMYMYLGFLGGIAIILALGGLMSCRTFSGTTTLFLMVLFYAGFAGFAVMYVLSQAINKRSVFVLGIGLPLLFLTLGHLLWAVFCKTNFLNIAFSGFLILLSVGTAIVCVIIQDAIHPDTIHVPFACVLLGTLQGLLGASWVTACKFSIKLGYKLQYNPYNTRTLATPSRFFFVLTSMIFFAFIFVLGVTVIPLICGLRYLCIKFKEPTAPVKPTDPTKPTKPTEPQIGASNEEWTYYRRSMTEYRKRKDKWKEEHQYFKENQSRLMIEYEKKQRTHSKKVAEYKAKVVEPAKGRLVNYCTCSTTQVFFCKEETPDMVKILLKTHYEEGESNLAKVQQMVQLIYYTLFMCGELSK
eukprot:TRINITY_DN88276_c0_g1_i1.p1 TRINITY_DN88276_c0_g1~~TRINITY_DN88276_c0_g1_i1.p1  ORF type:complete len:418 (-),score=19.44 TRINITY_DN88276_c0_g1_i1:43-1296(-)